ncbi:MAG: histidine phosphatase family protein [Gemmiger sp.]|uniref:histidine phosphatase family protein n=1 Tax=Gemmiger sp. TaxID=2049027 RepID=UPI002A9174C1|nr:histidine phosphatase family protein [Gemmiger sp.]MDY5326248.1 histidine phosphatase family protein [Gemmiger sp.]
MQYYKLHLIRHGLTAGNLDGRYIGSGTDLPLCDEGRAQLAELKGQFPYPQVPLVFTSPLRRATETAQILFPDAKIVALDDLKEMNFGKFENRPVTELVKDPEFAAWMDPSSREVPEGAEDRKAFFDRTSNMLMKMFEYQLKTHTVEAACITHGGVIMNMMASHVLPSARPEEWMTDPGCGYSVRLDAEMWMRDHLAEAFDVVPRGYLDDIG